MNLLTYLPYLFSDRYRKLFFLFLDLITVIIINIVIIIVTITSSFYHYHHHPQHSIIFIIISTIIIIIIIITIIIIIIITTTIIRTTIDNISKFWPPCLSPHRYFRKISATCSQQESELIKSVRCLREFTVSLVHVSSSLSSPPPPSFSSQP